MRTIRITWVQISSLLIMLFTATGSRAMSPPPIPEENMDSFICELIEENIAENKEKEVSLSGIYLDMAPLVYRFYTQNEYQRVWTTEKHKKTTDEVLQLLKNSMQFGIDPQYFALSYLLFLKEDMEKQHKIHKKSIRATQFEFLMTHTVLKFSIILEKGEHYYEKTDFYDTTNAYLNRLPSSVLGSIYSDELVNTLLKSHPESKIYTESTIDFMQPILSLEE